MTVEELAGRVMVDTNVLIYSTLATDPRHHRAQEVLALRQQRYFDQRLAALMLREEIPVTLTENDKDFKSMEGITPVNPFA